MEALFVIAHIKIPSWISLISTDLINHSAKICEIRGEKIMNCCLYSDLFRCRLDNHLCMVSHFITKFLLVATR